MGGYSFTFHVTTAVGGKKKALPTKDQSCAALASVWSWYRRELDRLAAVDREFVDQLTSYWELWDDPATSHDMGGIARVTGDELELVLRDCGGEGYCASLATAHILWHLVSRDLPGFEALLKPHKLTLCKPWSTDRFIADTRFFMFRGAISDVLPLDSNGEAILDRETFLAVDGSDEQADLLVEMDASGFEGSDNIRASSLAGEERAAVHKFWSERRCHCPMCRQHR